MQCILAPCCAQWSCAPPPAPALGECPPTPPQLGSPCTGQQEGAEHCEYGEKVEQLVMCWSDERAMCQECCGELYPEVIMECWGVWQGYYVDTTCDIGQSPCYHHHHHLTVHIMPRSALPHHHPLHPGHLSSSAP